MLANSNLGSDECPTRRSGERGCLFGLLIGLLEMVPAFRRLMDRLQTVALHAPAGPPRSQAAIAASYGGGRVMVRISLSERAGFGTEMTISGLGATGVSSDMRELRRSIEIQAGSLTPYRPPRQGGWEAHRASGGRLPLARSVTTAYGDRRREALMRGPHPGGRDHAEPLARNARGSILESCRPSDRMRC